MALSLILCFQRVSKWKTVMGGPDTGDQGNQVLLQEDKTLKECTLLQEVETEDQRWNYWTSILQKTLVFCSMLFYCRL